MNRKKAHTRSPQPKIEQRTYSAPGAPPLVSKEEIILQQSLSLDAAVVNGLKQREINVKEAFTIRDATGTFYRASLKEMRGDSGQALPYEKMERSPEPLIHLTLACSVLGRQRMLFVMQKATELGVSEIYPLLTEFSVPTADLEHEKASAWPGQILRAARQCRRSSLPELHAPTTLDAFLESSTCKSANVRVVLDDRSEPNQSTPSTVRRVVLLVGPEGGFSEPERERLKGITQPWVLGGRILRAETAVVAGLTAVQMAWGDYAPLISR